MRKLLLALLLMLDCAALPALSDLNLLCQDYVIETKRVIVPEHPWAFNPSIVRWQGQLLMFFRIRDPVTLSTNQIGITWLDEEFNPASAPQILTIHSAYSHLLIEREPGAPTVQDPRVLMVGDDLYMVYSNIATTENVNIERMFISLIHFDGEKFYADPPQILLDYEGKEELRREKNWVPFEFANRLLLAYSLIPHRIFMPIPETSACFSISCSSIAASQAAKKWYWGVLRGGTPAYLIDGEYLAFFHSLKGMASVQSNGDCITHYFMGAYTFASTPPFGISKLSSKPVMHPSFYDGPAYATWKPLLAVYPCGYVYDDKHIWISYGKQDFEMWIAKIDKNKLMQSLIPVIIPEEP